MHDIEPYFKWRQYYVSSQDEKSQFYGSSYSEFTFTKKVYNYYIHPQWDSIGSPTLYVKNLFTEYDEGYAIIELIGEWNDCLNNDIMFLKRELADNLIHRGIHKFILICDNVLEFHGSDDSYYEEWWDDIKEEGGWVAILNTREHILKEMEQLRLQHYVNINGILSDVAWRKSHPRMTLQVVERILEMNVKQLG